MTGFRKRMAQGLVATTLLCAVGFMVCGSWSAPGNTWERVCIVLVFVMLASMIGALALVAATYVKFRGELARHSGRPPLFGCGIHRHVARSIGRRSGTGQADSRAGGP